MYSYLTLATVVAVAFGAAVHQPGYYHDGYVAMHPLTAFVPHPVDAERVIYVYPVNVRSHAAIQEPASASCVLIPTDGRVQGTITLTQQNDATVTVSGQITGLTPGLHGFHLHRDGNTGDMCKAAGPHFNPANNTHGGPTDSTRHAGDFGNIEADLSGAATVNFHVQGISLRKDAVDSAVGRAFVVHAKADDLGRGRDAESLKTGNAGARVACCIVTV